MGPRAGVRIYIRTVLYFSRYPPFGFKPWNAGHLSVSVFANTVRPHGISQALTGK